MVPVCAPTVKHLLQDSLMNNFRIGTRLALAFSVLLIMVAILAGVGLWNIDTANQAAPNDTGRVVFIVLALATLMIGIVLSVTITRSIVRPLHSAIQVAQTIAAHDLTVKIEAQGKDETAALLRALQQMTENLHSVLARVREGAHEITAASQQILAGNGDLSVRTEDQASSLTQTASAMEELTATVRQNADNAQQANTLAMTAANVATRGGDMVSQVVNTMDSINESSKKVEDIIGVIDSIAFQTNILALNAAVESARAGEAGRGFAVVASEVRSLAQRSAQAAREIKELIKESVSATAEGNRLVADTGATMAEIVESIQRVTDIMGEITAASEEQTSGIEQVNDAVHNMDQVTRQNATLVQEAEAAAGSLQQQADHLAKLVDTFKMQGLVARAPRTALPPTSAGAHAGAKNGNSEPVAQAHTAKPALNNPAGGASTSTSTRATAASALPSPSINAGSNPIKPAAHKAGVNRSGAPLRTTASGVTVGAYQTSAGAVEEWEEF